MNGKKIDTVSQNDTGVNYTSNLLFQKQRLAEGENKRETSSRAQSPRKLFHAETLQIENVQAI